MFRAIHILTFCADDLPKLGEDDVTQLLVTGMMIALAGFLVLMPAWVLDPRTLDGAAIWTKPQKFNISLALHFATLALLAQQLPEQIRAGRVMRVTTYALLCAFLVETLYIIIQAARGTRSHYNFDTPIEGMIYAAMGVGAVAITGTALVLAIQIARYGDRSRRGLWLGSVIGLSLGFAATLFFTSFLTEGRYVGAPLEGGGAVIPILGWSLEYGDLRPAHFVALHIMQIVPLLGWLSDRRGWNPVIVVICGAQSLLGLATFFLLRALAGQPILTL
ncbi:MAG: hypothetical protein AAF732_11585 [Pseudomonadota bacterium]